ncbi:MAG: YlxM family DNA-binding protein [Lachnospiraceae bacterium]|nr:YlxM family DNA-binding protein [Lachnospiraceae bacterium]
MNDLVRKSLLYDFYGALLTDHQREIYEEVVLNDYSMSEIAEEEGISRQGVHDMIRRCDKALEEYEAKLGLVAKFKEIEKLAKQSTDQENARKIIDIL